MQMPVRKWNKTSIEKKEPKFKFKQESLKE